MLVTLVHIVLIINRTLNAYSRECKGCYVVDGLQIGIEENFDYISQDSGSKQ